VKGGVKNRAASVLARLRTISQVRQEGFQLVLERYALERLLYRLSRSAHRERFVLKGAMLFAVWGQEAYRPTRDLDFLGYGPNEPSAVAECFREICEAAVPDDGLVFRSASVRAEPIRDDAEYGGIRVKLEARLGQARLQLQVDVGFGDAVVPPPVEEVYPVLLDDPQPRIRVYPREVVVAEKVHTLLVFGEATSRMKDLYDLMVLSMSFPFDGKCLATAIKETFKRRQTPLPDSIPAVLSSRFFDVPDKAALWRVFLERNGLKRAPENFTEVGERLRAFLWPVVQGAKEPGGFAGAWPQGGPWG